MHAKFNIEIRTFPYLIFTETTVSKLDGYRRSSYYRLVRLVDESNIFFINGANLNGANQAIINEGVKNA